MHTHYIKTDNFITLFPGNDTNIDTSYVIPKSSYYFNLLTEEVLDQIGEFDTAARFKRKIHELETEEESKFIKAIVRQMESVKLSGLPLFNFWNELVENVYSQKDRMSLLTKAVKGELVITWDGKIVLNSRASYLPREGYTTPEIMNQPYQPNTTFSDLSKPAIAGSITWAANHCPDAGNIYEVLVQVKDLVIPLKDSERYELTSFTYLDNLKVYGYGVNNVQVTTNNSSYGPLVIRKPQDKQAMFVYLQTLVPGTNSISQPHQVPVKQTGC